MVKEKNETMFAARLDTLKGEQSKFLSDDCLARAVRSDSKSAF
jgi:hypothetical protein